MNRKQKTFRQNQKTPHSQPGPHGAGPAGPPRNIVTKMPDIVITFMNSARKNRAKRIDEYSVWKPPTSSCSASTRSKGGRLSSAVPAIRNTTKGTNAVVHRFQFQVACSATITLVERLPELSSTASSDRP